MGRRSQIRTPRGLRTSLVPSPSRYMRVVMHAASIARLFMPEVERDKLAASVELVASRLAWRTKMIKLRLRFAMSAFALLVGLDCAAVAQDKLRIAGGLAGTWENSFSELGQNAGFFKKHGLVLEIFYT